MFPTRFLSFVLLVLPVCLAGCGDGDQGSGLESLTGRWTTTDERYAGRHFEFTTGRELVLGKGEDGEDVCPIDSVVGTPAESGRLLEYEVVYDHPEDGESVFAFEYSVVQDTIRLRNQKRTSWKRVER